MAQPGTCEDVCHPQDHCKNGEFEFQWRGGGVSRTSLACWSVSLVYSVSPSERLCFRNQGEAVAVANLVTCWAGLAA